MHGREAAHALARQSSPCSAMDAGCEPGQTQGSCLAGLSCHGHSTWKRMWWSPRPGQVEMCNKLLLLLGVQEEGALAVARVVVVLSLRVAHYTVTGQPPQLSRLPREGLRDVVQKRSKEKFPSIIPCLPPHPYRPACTSQKKVVA